MSRVRVIALWVVGVAVALVVVGWVGLKWYLSSSSARGLAAAKIGETLGLPVEVESLDVGVASTTATVRIPDAAADTPGDLVRIGSVTTDITLGDLLTGRVNPTKVTAKDVELLLRIDADGNILSPLPKFDKPGSGAGGPLPVVELASARVRIRQTGKPEFDLTGVSGALKPDGDGSAISGAVDDPKWGKWKVSGKLAANPADGRVELTTDQGPLSDPLLHSIPYVPPVVWEHLSAAGTAAAVVTFTFRPDDFRFLVELNPQKADLTIPDADVTVTQVQGRIRIDGEKVTVDDGSVVLADGRVAVAGTYRFDQPTAVIALKLDAKGVDVRRLPAGWGLPKEITGRLKGAADLELRIPPDGKLETLGSGTGELEDAKFAGLPAEIKLNLRGVGGRYRFDTTQPR